MCGHIINEGDPVYYTPDPIEGTTRWIHCSLECAEESIRKDIEFFKGCIEELEEYEFKKGTW